MENDKSIKTKEDLKEIFQEPLGPYNLNVLIQNYIQLISGDEEMMDLLVDYVTSRIATETLACYLLLRDILQIDREFQRAALRKFKDHEVIVKKLYLIKAIAIPDKDLSKLAKEVASLLSRSSHYKSIFEKVFTTIPLDEIGSTARIERSVRSVPRKSNRDFTKFDSETEEKGEHIDDSASHVIMARPPVSPEKKEEEKGSTGRVPVSYVRPRSGGADIVDDSETHISDEDEIKFGRGEGYVDVTGSRASRDDKTGRKTSIMQKINGDNAEVVKTETFTYHSSVRAIHKRGGVTEHSHVTLSITEEKLTTKSGDESSYSYEISDTDDDKETSTNDSTSTGIPTITNETKEERKEVDYTTNDINKDSDESKDTSKKLQISTFVKMIPDIPICQEGSPKILISIDDNPANNKPIFDMIEEDEHSGIVIKTFISSIEFSGFVTRNIRTLMSYRHNQDKIRFITDRSRVEVPIEKGDTESLKVIQNNHAYKNVTKIVRDEIGLKEAKILIYTGSGIGNIRSLHNPSENIFVTWFQDIAFQFAYFSDYIEYHF